MAKKKREEKEATEDEISTKRVSSWKLKLNRQELTHLRDLLSILLPNEMSTTVSQSLAKSQGRQPIEALLWQRVSSLCVEAGLPTEEDAPDFIVSASSSPSIDVFEITSDAMDDDRPSDESCNEGDEP